MKCDVSFHKVAQVHYLGEVSMFLCMCENVLHAYSSEKLQKSKSFPRVMITNVLPRFYESQCRSVYKSSLSLKYIMQNRQRNMVNYYNCNELKFSAEIHNTKEMKNRFTAELNKDIKQCNTYSNSFGIQCVKEVLPPLWTYLAMHEMYIDHQVYSPVELD